MLEINQMKVRKIGAYRLNLMPLWGGYSKSLWWWHFLCVKK